MAAGLPFRQGIRSILADPALNARLRKLAEEKLATKELKRP